MAFAGKNSKNILGFSLLAFIVYICTETSSACNFNVSFYDLPFNCLSTDLILSIIAAKVSEKWRRTNCVLLFLWCGDVHN